MTIKMNYYHPRLCDPIAVDVEVFEKHEVLKYLQSKHNQFWGFEISDEPIPTIAFCEDLLDNDHFYQIDEERRVIIKYCKKDEIAQ